MKLILFILLMAPIKTWAQVLPSVELERIGTEYRMETDAQYPSCTIFQFRRREREKVLRELKYVLDKEAKSMVAMDSDYFVTNQYFLDADLWYDETILVISMWKLPTQLVTELQNLSRGPYLWLTGDGVNWDANIQLFPTDVKFDYDLEAGTMVTTHRAYFVDYCSPREKSRLRWFPEGTATPLDTMLQIQNLKAMKGL
jgi:hypothetical protein